MNTQQKIALLTISFALAAVAHPVMAATHSPNPTITQASQKSLEDLKERLATKVAELRNVVTRAISGTVFSVSVSSGVIETTAKNYKVEFEDELSVAQILNGKRTELSLEDIEKGDLVTVFGSYDGTLELLKAKFVFIESKKVYTRVIGTITNIDKEAFAITILTQDGKTMTSDIEKTTKAFSWSTTDGIVKSGFSKMIIADTVHVIGTLDPKKDTNVSAIRILNLFDLSGVAPTATLAPSPTSTASATPKPTVKPSATPKPTVKP
ncbi:MAG: hypothetical protein AAB492_01130 [Patescibacteria group bacterium]